MESRAGSMELLLSIDRVRARVGDWVTPRLSVQVLRSQCTRASSLLCSGYCGSSRVQQDRFSLSMGTDCLLSLCGRNVDLIVGPFFKSDCVIFGVRALI